MKRLAVLIVAVALSGCARRDFAGLCKLAKEILVEPRVTPDMRLERLVRDTPNVAYGRGVRDVVAALPQLRPRERYPAILGAARAEGMSDWSCPALESVVVASEL